MDLSLNENKLVARQVLSSLAVSPSREQGPIIYRRFTFHEVVTPTKEGVGTYRLFEGSCIGFTGQSPINSRNVASGPSVTDFSRKSLSQSFVSQHSSSGSELNVPPKLKRSLSVMGIGHTNISSLNSTMPCTSQRSFPQDSGKDSMKKRHVGSVKRPKLDPAYMSDKMSVSKRDDKEKSKDQKYKKLHWKYVLLLPLIPIMILLGCTALMLQGKNLQPNSYEAIDVAEMKDALLQNVFGQNDAILKLLSVLGNPLIQGQSGKTQPPGIIITGGNGVGKSLAMSIVARNVKAPAQSQYLAFPPFPSHGAVLERFSILGQNMVIVDDLNIDSTIDAINWVKTFSNEAAWQEKYVWIVLVFNTQPWDARSSAIDDEVFHEIMKDAGRAVHHKFVASGLNMRHVQFSPLENSVVEKCIRVAVKRRGIRDDNEIEKLIVEISNLEQDKHQGCKRVWSRVISLKT